jgi:NDP-sugar pyrophosphorylase family protein
MVYQLGILKVQCKKDNSLFSRQCVVLVGGIGSRLKELTRDVPKPMLLVAGRPFIQILIEWLIGQGMQEIIFLAGFKASVLENFLKEKEMAQYWPNIKITCFVENKIAGTAGALVETKYLYDILGKTFFVINGDSFFDISLSEFCNIQIEKNWIGCLALRTVEDASRYGLIELENNLIVSFSEKTQQKESGLINGGVYLFKKEIFDFIQHSPCSLEKEIFPVLVKEGLLYGKELIGFFIDIGIPDTYLKAQEYF